MQSRIMLLVLCAVAPLSACSRNRDEAIARTGGDPGRGRAAIRQYGCGTCHTIPGIKWANAQVGPPLDAMADRAYVAGLLPNTAEHLIRFIQHPQEVHPGSAMVDMGVTDRDARDIAAYLSTLRAEPLLVRVARNTWQSWRGGGG